MILLETAYRRDKKVIQAYIPCEQINLALKVCLQWTVSTFPFLGQKDHLLLTFDQEYIFWSNENFAQMQIIVQPQ